MLSKNLHLCFTAIKKPTTTLDSSQIPFSEDDQFRSSSTSTNTTTATASFSSSVLVKNFNSLYDHTPESSASKSISRTSDDFSTSDSDTESTEPDFATIFASQRFFISSPGHSNSIIESSPSSSSESSCRPESDTLVVGGGVPCPTYSPDPYMDFRQSMQEMVESRKMSDVTSDWDFLHELLLCYLALNPKHAHSYIIGAFADLLITLMAADEEKNQKKSRHEISSSDDPCTVSR